MRATHKPTAAAVLIAAATVFAGAAPAAAADFYKDRTLTLYVGSGAGGGYDFFGRVFVKYYGKYIPGRTCGAKYLT